MPNKSGNVFASGRVRHMLICISSDFLNNTGVNLLTNQIALKILVPKPSHNSGNYASKITVLHVKFQKRSFIKIRSVGLAVIRADGRSLII